MRPDPRGLTLVELVVALALVGVLAAVGTPYLLANLPALRVNAAVRHVIGDLRLARSLAVERGVDCLLVFDVPAVKYTVILDTDDVPGVSDGDEVLKEVDLGRRYRGVAFGSATAADPITFGGDQALFKPRGTSNGGSVHLRPGQDAGVRQDRERRVTVLSTTGRVRAFRRSGSQWEG
ncbi:MAG: GspH/FimT family pseudopilin [Deferrisomatales bacterium]|nr:GspH/FimT family pseudopilin [Deferrisomatales bacterium]